MSNYMSPDEARELLSHIDREGLLVAGELRRALETVAAMQVEHDHGVVDWEQVEAQVIDWLRSQYGPLPVYRYSPHDTPPALPEGHFRIGRDGTVTPTAPWNRDSQNE